MHLDRLTASALLMALAALVAGCGGQPAAEKPAAPVTAVPAARPAFAAPDLSAMDAAVREQITAALRRVEESRPAGGAASAAAWLRLGQLYQAYDLLEPAAAAYENAAFDDPARDDVRHGLALVRQRQGRLDEAARLLRQELESRKTAAAAYRLGQVEKAAGRAAAARGALTEARALDPDCVAATYELGLVAVQEGQLDEAVTLFEEVLRRQPAAVQTHFPLGQALQRLGRKDAAAPHLAASAAREQSIGGKATCNDPFEAELRPLTTGAAAHILRGQAARLAGRLDQALLEYRQAVAVAPNDPIAHQALGRFLASRGNLDGALAEYREATRLDPQAAELQADLGLLLEQKGDRREAGRRFRAALEKNANLVPAHLGLARLALAEGEAGPALASLGKVLELEPANAPARGLRAELLMELKKPAEALADIRHLLDHSPPADPLEHASLAWAAAALGDPERARQHLEAVAQEADADAKAKAAAHYRLGCLAVEQNQTDRARRELEQALALDPGLEPARRLLAQLTRAPG